MRRGFHEDKFINSIVKYYQIEIYGTYSCINMAKKIKIPTEKIKELFNKAVTFIKNFPDTFKKSPIDEKIAYIVILVGVLFVILGIIL